MNPFAAPNAPLSEPLPKSGAAAVFVGAAVGNGTSYVVLFMFGLVFFWVLVAQGVPTQELYARAYQSTSYLLFAHFIGLICLVPGGYWSARLSPDRPVVYALLAGAVVSAFSVLSNLLPYDLPIPLWSRVASVILPFPGFLLGAVCCRRAA